MKMILMTTLLALNFLGSVSLAQRWDNYNPDRATAPADPVANERRYRAWELAGSRGANYGAYTPAELELRNEYIAKRGYAEFAEFGAKKLALGTDHLRQYLRGIPRVSSKGLMYSITAATVIGGGLLGHQDGIAQDVVPQNPSSSPAAITAPTVPKSFQSITERAAPAATGSSK